MHLKLLTATLVAVAGLAVVIATACSGELSPADAVGASVERFSEIESFRVRFHLTSDADSATAADGEIAYRSDRVAYYKISSGDETEALFLPPDLYFRTPDHRWYVLSPWDQGIPRDELPESGPDDLILDYRRVAHRLSGIEQLPDETIDGERHLHYAGNIGHQTPESEVASSELDLSPFGITASTLDVGLWLQKETYLPRTMLITEMASDDEAGPLVEITFQFFDYNQRSNPPEPPENARPWRDLELPEAPCTGSQFASCLEAQAGLESVVSDACTGAGTRICLVPLGQVSPDLVQHLVAHYQEQYGLSVTVLTPSAIPADIANPRREQIGARTLIEYMGLLFPREYSDRNAVLIGLTAVDLYDEESHFRYLFGLKGTPADPKAVISTFRMNPETYGERPDADVFFSRARKMLSKYIGLLFYGLPPSSDPESPLYDSILGPADLDFMTEPLPVASEP